MVAYVVSTELTRRLSREEDLNENHTPKLRLLLISILVYLISPVDAGVKADIGLRTIRGEALTHTASMLERENIDRFACYVAALD